MSHALHTAGRVSAPAPTLKPEQTRRIPLSSRFDAYFFALGGALLFGISAGSMIGRWAAGSASGNAESIGAGVGAALCVGLGIWSVSHSRKRRSAERG